MNLSQRLIIEWASQRVTYLDGQKNYEDSYAVSQEFCEWTVSLDVYPQRIKAATMLVPDFNKEKSYD